MTAVDLSAIRAQLAGITPGPWEFVGPDIEQCGEVFGTVIENSVDCGSYCYGGSVKQEVKAADAAFIAAAPSTVAGLLAVVERVEALHTMEHAEVPVWQYGIKSGGEVCSLDGQAWPCETITAITGEGGADGP